jgi:hypothetical protein
VDKVYESEMFVEHVAVVLDALLEVGDAHIPVAITLQGAQEGLFGEAGDLLRHATYFCSQIRGAEVRGTNGETLRTATTRTRTRTKGDN